MKKGWIHLHRKIQECEIWVNNEPFDIRSAWIDLLLLANHEDVEMVFDYSPMLVKRGQFLTSVRKLGARWGWSKNRVLKYLRLLESLNMIERESNNQRTLITIVKYGVYQGDEDTDVDTTKDTGIDTVVDTGTDTGMPQTRMKKNEKNEKNEKNRGRFTPPTLDEIRDYVFESGINIDAEAFFDHYTSNGWLISGRSKMKDWKAAVRNWERNDRKWGRQNNKPQATTQIDWSAI